MEFINFEGTLADYDFGHIGTESFVAMGLATVLAIILPLIVAIVWCKVKKEKFTTVLIGAATFMLFAIVLEKSIQTVVVQMDNPVSRFLNASPFLLALVLALFPGVFEETGRFVAFKTVLRRRKNRETSISHGIGHGCFEVMFILGLAFSEYFVYGLMINAGSFGELAQMTVDATPVPGIEEQFIAIAETVASIGIGSIWLSFVERIFAVMFHIACSMLVFYACKDKKKWWLYPLAVVLHTLVDFLAAGLTYVGLVTFPIWVSEIILGVAGVGLFLLAYVFLYRKDKAEDEEKAADMVG